MDSISRAGSAKILHLGRDRVGWVRSLALWLTMPTVIRADYATGRSIVVPIGLGSGPAVGTGLGGVNGSVLNRDRLTVCAGAGGQARVRGPAPYCLRFRFPIAVQLLGSS